MNLNNRIFSVVIEMRLFNQHFFIGFLVYNNVFLTTCDKIEWLLVWNWDDIHVNEQTILWYPHYLPNIRDIDSVLSLWINFYNLRSLHIVTYIPVSFIIKILLMSMTSAERMPSVILINLLICVIFYSS